MRLPRLRGSHTATLPRCGATYHCFFHCAVAAVSRASAHKSASAQRHSHFLLRAEGAALAEACCVRSRLSRKSLKASRRASRYARWKQHIAREGLRALQIRAAFCGSSHSSLEEHHCAHDCAARALVPRARRMPATCRAYEASACCCAHLRKLLRTSACAACAARAGRGGALSFAVQASLCAHAWR